MESDLMLAMFNAEPYYKYTYVRLCWIFQAFLDAMLDIKWVTDNFKISRLQSIREYCRVLQSITEYYRVLRSVTEY